MIELHQMNIDYLKDNYHELLSLGILAVGDRERLEQLPKPEQLET